MLENCDRLPEPVPQTRMACRLVRRKELPHNCDRILKEALTGSPGPVPSNCKVA
ncbi:hypothetical protein [Laspinema sp. D2d]|uniref:hypothetical protein n=1 Tax=Laspinema sp. D2d TaxID=2953686 RepID=UPI0021BA7512|nr:hypothetical protein [Laspinema sp. D2d]